MLDRQTMLREQRRVPAHRGLHVGHHSQQSVPSLCVGKTRFTGSVPVEAAAVWECQKILAAVGCVGSAPYLKMPLKRKPQTEIIACGFSSHASILEVVVTRLPPLHAGGRQVRQNDVAA